MEAISTTTSSNITLYSQRPEKLKSYITALFNDIAQDDCSKWGRYNGRITYSLSLVEEAKLLHKLILKTPAQKDFYFLDIGGGEFTLNRAIAENLNQQQDIPEHVTVHLIGVRGERLYKGNPNFANAVKDVSIVKSGKCILHNYGNFKIEELEIEFSKRGLDLTSKIDVIVSSWCFTHLADPVGTFEQAYNLLKPGTGLFFGDKFTYLDGGHAGDDTDTMVHLLKDIGAPFVYSWTFTNPESFIVNRPDANPCNIPLSYSGMDIAEERPDKCAVLTIFTSHSPREQMKYPDEPSYGFFGNQSLFNWFINNDFIFSQISDRSPVKKFASMDSITTVSLPN